MSIDIKKMTKQIKEGIDKMTAEDYVKNILCLNGVMTKELFDKVINELIEKTGLNDETILYHVNDYNITIQEFMDVFHYLDKLANKEKVDIGESFQNDQAFFEYDGIKFIWDLLLGQGSSCSLYIYGYNQYEWRDDLRIVIKEIDPNLRFYKKLE